MFSVSPKLFRLLISRKKTLRTGKYEFSTSWNTNCGRECSDYIHKAEKIAGHPTSYLALKTLFSDEIPNISNHLKVLLETKHPLVAIGRKVIYEGRNSFQKRGLIVLLLSKAANKNFQESKENNFMSSISQSQRSLAEITEMIYAAQLIHKGVINLTESETRTGENLEFGNKMSILLGDYVLANACRNLAALRNPDVVEIISSSISDFVESEFLAINRKQSFISTIDEWKERNYLSAGSLLAKSCQAAALLAGHSSHIQNICFQFGKNIALSWQIYNEMKPFNAKNIDTTINIDLNSAPVLFHNQSFTDCSIKTGNLIKNTCSHEKVHTSVKNGPALEMCKTLYNGYIENALELLQQFKKSDARAAMENIAKFQN